MKAVSPILVADVFGFIDALISFWGQKAKATVHSDRKTRYGTIGVDCTKVRSHFEAQGSVPGTSNKLSE